MFTGNLKGIEEHIFRQSVMGSIGHIVTNYDDFMAWVVSGPTEMRIETYCGRNYKYNTNYSSMDGRNGVVRNACEYCFTEYDPDERREERRKSHTRTSDNELPF